MSKISVWSSEGKWSEDVIGLDKVHLMRRAILIAWGLKEEDEESDLNGYEIDHHFVFVPSFYDDEEHYRPDPDEESIRWRRFAGSNPHLKFSAVRFFTMPLIDLDRLMKNDPVYAPIYSKIKDAAKIPSSLKVNSILLRFDDE